MATSSYVGIDVSKDKLEEELVWQPFHYAALS
jgi:hypothetical protein